MSRAKNPIRPDVGWNPVRWTITNISGWGKRPISGDLLVFLQGGA
jgi:hypothetical protein